MTLSSLPLNLYKPPVFNGAFINDLENIFFAKSLLNNFNRIHGMTDAVYVPGFFREKFDSRGNAFKLFSIKKVMDFY